MNKKKRDRMSDLLAFGGGSELFGLLEENDKEFDLVRRKKKR